jgi:hypothetical protein
LRSTLLAGLALWLCATACFSQSNAPQSSEPGTAQQQQRPAETPAGTPTLPNAPVPTPKSDIPKPLQQPKRILGIMPNYRAVSAGAIPPPPRPKEAFKIATENSFDYSAFVFVGITSLLAEGTNTHPPLGKRVAGFGRYYWRGWLDKTSGNYMVDFVMPTIVHEDERYYAKGEGPLLNRAVYAATRILITPNYQGRNTFNAAEILGRGVSQAISLTYYPSSDQTLGGFSDKYAYALGRDALTNVFREFWPDIAHRLKKHRSH